MNNKNYDELRNNKSSIQKLKPRKTMCDNCPHKNEVITKTCDIRDMEIFCLEEPHICHQERDGLCRGAVEKMIMNYIFWETDKEDN